VADKPELFLRKISAIASARDRQSNVAHSPRGQRSIPIHADLAAALSACRQIAKPSAYVVARSGGGATPLAVNVWLERAFKTHRLDRLLFASGQRTFVTRAIRMV